MTSTNYYTFFILDDDPVMLGLMTRLLEMEGHHVVSSTDSINAAARINDTKPDCLITDLVMPHRDGLDVVDDLSEFGAFPTLTIIIVTTRTKDMWRKMALDKGVHGFIPKPIDPETFADQVSDIILARVNKNTPS